MKQSATSADFAIVVVIDLDGLGFDDARNEYAVEKVADRRERKRAVIDALSYTLMNQPGANSSQQFPHVMDFQGAILTSSTKCPAPTVSAMKDDYLQTLESLVSNINKMNGNDAVALQPVSSLDDAVDVLTKLSTTE